MLLRLVPSVRWGRWLTATLILVISLAAFAAMGVFQAGVTAIGPPLFFTCMFAYMPPVMHYIVERAGVALRDLDTAYPGVFDLDAELKKLSHRSKKHSVAVLAGAMIIGLLHNVALSGGFTSLWKVFTTSSVGTAVILGTFVVWIVTSSALAIMVDIARQFGKLAKRVPISLLDTVALTPFGRVGVTSTLAVIGTMSFFPVMLIGNNTPLTAFYPGFFAAVGTLVAIVSLSLLPVHRILSARKAVTLKVLDQKIRAFGEPDVDDVATLEQLRPLLSYRREIRAVSEWPLDMNVVTRFGLYAIIPPLTWVGAALIENVVDYFL